MTNKTKSIWKPLSELLDITQDIDLDIYIKWKNGFIGYCVYRAEGKTISLLEERSTSPHNKHIESFCTLTDFIKNQESLEERITKLEADKELPTCDICDREVEGTFNEVGPDNHMGDHFVCDKCSGWEGDKEEAISKKETSERLPEVGKRYKHNNDKSDHELVVTSIDDDFVYYKWSGTATLLNGDQVKDVRSYTWLESFLGNYEEIPDQEPTTEESSTVGVQEALKELEKELENHDITKRIDNHDITKRIDNQVHGKDSWYGLMNSWRDHALKLKKLSQNLVNALEKEKK